MPYSNATKRAFADALRKLLEQKPFAKISVSHICEECGMNRKSFYYHFKDKYDLVNWIFDTEITKIFSEEEWKDAIRLTFNAGAQPQIQAEQGVFAPGDNAYVDDLVFKGKDATPLVSFPFTAVLGKKVKGPDDYQEVKDRLVADYQTYLDGRWVDRLRSSAKVEINQEVLKTVNNH